MQPLVRLQLTALDKRLPAVWIVAQIGSLSWRGDIFQIIVLLINSYHTELLKMIHTCTIFKCKCCIQSREVSFFFSAFTDQAELWPLLFSIWSYRCLHDPPCFYRCRKGHYTTTTAPPFFKNVLFHNISIHYNLVNIQQTCLAVWTHLCVFSYEPGETSLWGKPGCKCCNGYGWMKSPLHLSAPGQCRLVDGLYGYHPDSKNTQFSVFKSDKLAPKLHVFLSAEQQI